MVGQKILIDVSHIISWKGNLTGIERVEYHVIKHYYDNPETEFIMWRNRQKRFVVVRRDYIKTAVVERASEKELQHKPVLPTRNLVKRVYRKLRTKPVPIQSRHVPGGTVLILAGLWDNHAYAAGLQQLAHTRQIVHVVYDMIPVVQRGYVINFLHRVFKKYAFSVLPVCDAILAISESTAQDTKAALSAQRLKVPTIRTFRLGDDITRAAKSKKPSALKGLDDFILTVGTVEARKNHRLLYYVQKQRALEGKPMVPIVIVGRMGWLSADFEHLSKYDPDARESMVILKMVSDAELKWLYENCLFTIFPSFYEGWGLPIAESLGYGKVTLAANTSSMPEVAGKLADYFSPFSTDQLNTLIEKYLRKTARESREKQIRSEYRPLAWDEAMKQFDQTLQQLIK